MELIIMKKIVKSKAIIKLKNGDLQIIDYSNYQIIEKDNWIEFVLVTGHIEDNTVNSTKILKVNKNSIESMKLEYEYSA